MLVHRSGVHALATTPASRQLMTEATRVCGIQELAIAQLAKGRIIRCRTRSSRPETKGSEGFLAGLGIGLGLATGGGDPPSARRMGFARGKRLACGCRR